MNVIYILLLLAGGIGFALHLYAQYRVATLIRRRHPQQWDIIARPESGRPSRMRTYARFQHVLRSQVPQMFEDTDIRRWHRIWRVAPWVAWPCWVAVLLIQARWPR